MSGLPILDRDAVLDGFKRDSEHRRYLAMYSSWLGGVVIDPSFMVVPVDDHIVHRGDGVFEAIRVVEGRIYALDAHLERLMRSASGIGLKVEHSVADMKQVCRETVAIARESAGAKGTAPASELMIRLFLSRGYGSFTPNPYDTKGSQIYLVVTEFKPVAEKQVKAGVRAAVSNEEVKSSRYAAIKSCNYLQNVMMRKEAADRGFDYTIGVDPRGQLTEGPTENIAFVTAGGAFVSSDYKNTLRGITLARCEDLLLAASESELSRLGLREIQRRSLSADELSSAREILMVGTTLDALSVTEFGGRIVGDGRPGPVGSTLRAWLAMDQRGRSVNGLTSWADQPESERGNL
jgi:branched-chain amino acid aminotransferase